MDQGNSAIVVAPPTPGPAFPQARPLLTPPNHVRIYQLLSLVLLASTASAQLQVVSFSPERHVLNAPRDASIVVEFDRPVNASSLVFARFYGSFTGPLQGTVALEGGDKILRFTPTFLLQPGEVVTVDLPRRLRAQDGTTLRQEGYAFRFRALTAPATMEFVPEEVYSVRSERSTLVRLYGAHAMDLNRDRRIDMLAVNEVSNDVRVLLNAPGGGNTFQSFISPVNSTDNSPSPSITADFNKDGNVDFATANTDASTITVMLGNGDGSFSSITNLWVGNGPRGIAALDVDGDGDTDIAASAQASSHMAILRNDGNANFAPAETFEGGGSREFGLEAQDMNNDGIMDLIVGLWSPQVVAVHLGNGNGTYSLVDLEPTGGEIWKLVCGDLNGDGNMDVSTGNGLSGNGSILLGDGLGNLTLHQTEPTGAFTTSTHLGDLDGDGDLDWIVSDFTSGKWTLFENDGHANFTVLRTFDAVSSPSCASMFDIDGDGDLDLALMDELADLIRLEFNKSPAQYLCFGDGGSQSPCTCDNASAVGGHRGCKNSTGQGALALATGTRSIAADDLVLTLTDMPPNKVGVLATSESLGSFPLGDGRFCLGSPPIRYAVQLSDASGTIVESDISSRITLAPGDRFWFQFAFRDATGPCGTGYNSSNAMGVAFIP